MRKPTLLILIVLLALLLLAASPLATPAIDWWSIGPGSAKLTQGSIELHGMVGQGIADQVSLASTGLCSGYLCLGAVTGNWIYLPTIQK